MPAPQRGGRHRIRITSSSTAMQPARMPAYIERRQRSVAAVSSVSSQVTLFRQRNAAFVAYNDVIERSHTDQIQRILQLVG